ncbi:MAG: DMT family transporter [Actinomycetota bacterium]
MSRASVLTTARGTRPEAFGPTEWGLLLAIALMWGSSFVFIDIALESSRPALIALVRIAAGTLAVGLLGRSRAKVDREDLPRIALLGIVWMAIPLLLFPIAQDLGVASSTAGMINGAMPLFAATFAAIMLGRAPAPRQAGGLVIGFAGIVLIFLPAARVPETALGAALALFATVLYGLAANLTVPLQQRYGALPVVFRAQLVALIAVLPFGLLALPDSSPTPSGWASMGALGLFGTGLAFIAMSVLVGRAGATRGAVAIYFIPVVALILGVTLRDETVPALALGGIALVLAGAWLTSRREIVR